MNLLTLRTVFWLVVIWCATPLVGGAAEPTPSGLTLHATRIIYPASAKNGITLSLTNNTNNAYLMQSWMRQVNLSTGKVMPDPEGADNSTATIPFIVTPPLKRAEAGEKITLLIRQTRNDLPKDRESVFFVSINAIPSITEKTAQMGNQLIVTVVNNIKLFYRPEGLPVDGIKQASSLIRFSQQGDQLAVNNPTPFYLTFVHLSVGGNPVTPSALHIMVPPKGLQHYPLPKGEKGDVEWQLVDENSEATPLQHQPL